MVKLVKYAILALSGAMLFISGYYLGRETTMTEMDMAIQRLQEERAAGTVYDTEYQETSNEEETNHREEKENYETTSEPQQPESTRQE